MISIHNIFHKKEQEKKLKEWENKEKEVLSRGPTKYYNATFEKNQKEEKQALNTPLKNITPKENESLIKIGDFYFTTRHNIESLDLELDLNIEKVQSITKNHYIALGEVEKKINFNATIFIEELAHFNNLIDCIAKRELLTFSSLIHKTPKKILITDFKASSRGWALDSQREVTFFIRDFNISGVLFE
ncbi:hypothetical protein [Helicobacter anatolicus]|uniref:hypothetical protein n=1 Tax=Helicobacter anatolicus TaxID=2905874 RepID=UPI001E4DD7CD|nr:hypothetical protein [Helicobacter anatolicus]MCE3040468.1 hypothetical protein [Helicobacter anatolicus]